MEKVVMEEVPGQVVSGIITIRFMYQLFQAPPGKPIFFPQRILKKDHGKESNLVPVSTIILCFLMMTARFI